MAFDQKTNIGLAVVCSSAKKLINDGAIGSAAHKVIMDQLKNIIDYTDIDVQSELVFSNQAQPFLLVVDSLSEVELHALDQWVGSNEPGFLYSHIVGRLFEEDIKNQQFVDKILSKAEKVCQVKDNFFIRAWMVEMLDYCLRTDYASDHDEYLLFRIVERKPELQNAFAEMLIKKIGPEQDYSMAETARCLELTRKHPSLYDTVIKSMEKYLEGELPDNGGYFLDKLQLAGLLGHDWIRPHVQKWKGIEDQETPEKIDFKIMMSELMGKMKNENTEIIAKLIERKGNDYIKRNLETPQELYALIEYGVVSADSFELDKDASPALRRAHISIDMGL